MENRNLFWGLVIKPGKRYETEVQEAFRVTKACIEPSSCKEGKVTSVMVECDNNEEFIITNLSLKNFNDSLDIMFNEGEKICFKVEGPGTVHLSGNLLEDSPPGGMYDMETDSDDVEESEEEEEAAEPVEPSQKRKQDLVNGDGKAKKAKKEEGDTTVDTTLGDLDDTDNFAEEEDSEDEDDDDDDDDDEDDDSEDEDTSMADTTAATEGSDDSEDDSDDDSEEEKKPETKKEPEVKKDQVKPVNGAMTPKGDKKPEKVEKTPKQAEKKEKQEPKTPKQDANAQKEGAVAKTSKESKTPKPEAKQEAKTPKQEAKTPKQEAKTPKVEAKTPKEEGKTPKTGKEVQTPGKTPKKTLKGGIQVEEVKEGNGPECKPGNMVGMYYEGRLKSNNKKFDGLNAGKPFKFKLGSGQVIKGWDIGVMGMKVGGKRKLIIPPKLGYGATGAPPDIPPNSTLVFDIECKFVK